MNRYLHVILTAALVAAALSASIVRAQPAAIGTITDHRPGSSDQPQYAAIWQAGAEERRWRAGDSPAAIEAPQDLTAAGFRLVDVEVWLEDDERRYLGVYRRSRARSLLRAGLDSRRFTGELRSQRAAGRCLVGLESWRENGKTLYAGVWSDADCGDERVFFGLKGAAFTGKQRELAKTHRLVDFEAVRTAGRTELAGVWHAGAEGRWHLLYAMSWDPFHEKLHELAPEGLRLADVEIDRVGKRTFYSGFFRAGAKTDWLGVGYHEHGFEIAHDNLASGKGYGLVEPEPFDELTLGNRAPGSGGRGVTPPSVGSVKMRLVALEVWNTRQHGIGQHGPPIHDSGSSGYP